MSRDKVITRDGAERSREFRREEAARWFVTLQHANPSARVLESWKKWESVPENRDAFDGVERMWRLVDAVSDLPATVPGERATDKYDGSVSVSEWRSNHTAESSHAHSGNFFLHTLGLAAAIAVIVLGFVNFLPEYFTTNSTHGRRVAVETGVAEHKEIVFEDGTRIHLGAQSSVTARFTNESRSVVLVRGEALFSVAPDSKRAFQVNAGSGVITALGTAFNVRHRADNEVVVTVTDGIVEVTPISILENEPMSTPAIPTLALGDEAGSATTERVGTEEAGEGEGAGNAANAEGDQRPVARRLVRGQEVTYDAQGNIGEVRMAQTSASTVWRDGRIEYLGEPLRHVIEDVNRYSRRKLILEDPAAGTLLYSGTVFARDIDDWIAGLGRIYPEIEVVALDDGSVLIRTRAAQSNIG